MCFPHSSGISRISGISRLSGKWTFWYGLLLLSKQSCLRIRPLPLCLIREQKTHAFSKPCLCPRDTRHFRRFRTVWSAKPLFHRIRMQIRDLRRFRVTPSFWQGTKARFVWDPDLRDRERERRFCTPEQKSVSQPCEPENRYNPCSKPAGRAAQDLILSCDRGRLLQDWESPNPQKCRWECWEECQ